MSDPSASYRGVLAANLASLALVGYVGARSLLLALETRGRVAAVLAVPPWYVYALGLALGLAGGLAALVARLRRVPPERRVYRLLPVACVLLLSVHFLVVPPSRLPAGVGADVIILSQLASLEPQRLAGPDGRLLSDPERIASALLPFSPPFVDRAGRPLARWVVVVRTGCEGPLTEVPGATEPGVLLYCLASDATRAWITAVGMGGAVAGPPAIVLTPRGEAAVLPVEIARGSAQTAPAGAEATIP